jgi:soluble lytic murein transglycosylase
MDQRCDAAPDRGRNARTTDPSQRARTQGRDAVSLLALALIILATPGALAEPSHKSAPSKPAAAASKPAPSKPAPSKGASSKGAPSKPADSSKKTAKADHAKDHAKSHTGKDSRRQDSKRTAGGRRNDRKGAHGVPLPPDRPAAASPAPAVPPELASTKQAVDLVHQHKFAEARTAAAAIGDPLAQKLVEWITLRHPDADAGLARYAAFVRANPDWPGIAVLRRRLEEKLWQGRHDARTIREFAPGEPVSVAGRLALAHAEMKDGKQADAETRVRAVWRSAQLSPETESAVLAAFPGALTRADHVARMDRRIGARDFGAAMRAAKHVGDDHVAIVKGCSGAESKPAKAKAGGQLNDVPAGVRSDLGYALCRLHRYLRNDLPGSNIGGHVVTPKEDLTAAARLALAASPDDLQNQDTDEWWRERRVLARKLLDVGDPKTAYRVVHEAAVPANPYYRADFHFMPGWIALRFLNDPSTALGHFARVDEGSSDPIVLARAAYWRGRALEAAGQTKGMRAQYEHAARFPTAYYGQLARARLGLPEIGALRPPPGPAPDVAAELVHAANILYRIGEKSLVRSFVTDLAEESNNAATIAALGQLTAQHDDAQSMFLMGKAALARGLALDQYAFPAIGVPAVNPVGGKVERCIVYSIVRTESAFDQRDKSAAKAVGLMQVTPGAGRDTAKRFGIAYDWNRLVSDPVYNTQMGTAEIAALLKDYRGSYILTFAGYNAGRGRVSQWLAQHGDPRDPKIDAVDWVERIPFSETRNYVQRVMENLQVYRARFGASTPTVEPNLHRATTVDATAAPR